MYSFEQGDFSLTHPDFNIWGFLVFVEKLAFNLKTYHQSIFPSHKY